MSLLAVVQPKLALLARAGRGSALFLSASSSPKNALLPTSAGGARTASASARTTGSWRQSSGSAAFLALVTLSVFALLYTSLRDPFALHRVRVLGRRAVHWYLRQLHVQPLAARATSAGVIFFVADAVAQRFGEEKFCVRRLLRYSGYGVLVMGPFLYAWYSLMHVYGPEDDFAGSLQKCLFEQVTLEPLCIVMYILYDGIVCARGWRATIWKMKMSFVPLWFKNGLFWLPANFSNYYIGTPDLRVIFANLCSLFWNAYFSAKVNAGVPTAGALQTPTASKARKMEKEISFFGSSSSNTVTATKYMPLNNHDRAPSVHANGIQKDDPQAQVDMV